MKKENGKIIVETLVDLFIWNENNNFKIEAMTGKKLKIIPEDKTYILEFILNKTEAEIFLNNKKVKRMQGNNYIIVREKTDNSHKLTDKEPTNNRK